MSQGKECVSDMPKTVLAIFCSDLHLSQKAPYVRTAEHVWYDAMDRALCDLRALASKYNCPVFCAGDIFHKWNEPTELVNWALTSLPDMTVIPGQHDLPFHRYADIEKTCIYNLVRHGKALLLEPKKPMLYKSHDKVLCVQGVPWECDLKAAKMEVDAIKIALVHKYVWIKGAEYPGAEEDSNIKQVHKQFGKHFNLCVYGDNHKGFGCMLDTTLHYNCGCLIRRKQDEKQYYPGIGLLCLEGDKLSMDRYELDTSLDKFVDEPVKEEVVFKIEGFIEDLKAAQGIELDFEAALQLYVKHNKVGKSVYNVLFAALQEELNA